MPNCHKIKLRGSSYRLVYQVLKKEIVVLVVAVGKREHLLVYQKSKERLVRNILLTGLGTQLIE